ncbi:neuroglobin-like isoform X2 [Pecten maximus]|nr:neuroglobin-like isoform X2 [Pecten maximus]XP_033735170.1 neuroglobin-like isoform X2 [Pecten maximus]XP_033735171.1 neuroglobin-like isoform X2 [Pecten maximus]
MGCSTSRTTNMEGTKNPLSSVDKTLIKKSWTEFTNTGSLADIGTPMFVKLFTDYPDVKTIFSFMKEGGGSIESEAVRNHAEGVMGVVGTAVEAIDNLDGLVPTVRSLGAKHYTYGAQAAHLGPVGECLLYAMEKELNEKFTLETKAAWLKLYSTISVAFQEGLEEEGRKQG